MKIIKSISVLAVMIISITKLQAQFTELGGNNSLAANGDIQTMCTDPFGNVYAAGLFTNSSGNYYVAEYNGISWSELGGPNALAAHGDITSICSDATGNIYAVGNFTNANGLRYVAKFNGGSWSELGGANSLSGACIASLLYTVNAYGGNVYVGGSIYNLSASSDSSLVMKFNSGTWSEAGAIPCQAGTNTVTTLTHDASGNMFAGGYFTNAGGNHFVAQLTGNTWSELGGTSSLGANGAILSLCVDNSGKVCAAGSFKNSNNKFYVARYNGATWDDLGGVASLNANNIINSICADAYGHVYAAGYFTMAGSFKSVAQFNNGSWSSIGNINPHGFIGYVNALACDNNNGNCYAGGDFANSNYNMFVALQAAVAFPLWYRDIDGDGYGDAYTYVHAQTQPSGYVNNGNDCLDVDATVHPNGNPYGLHTTGVSVGYATVAWTDGSCYTDSLYQVRYRVAGTTTWSRRNVLNYQTNYQFVNLTAGTTYETQVRAVFYGGTASPYTATTTFTTNTVCDAPTSISLTVNAYDATATWTNSGITIVQYRQAGTTTWTTITAPMGTSSAYIYGLMPLTTYKMRMHTKCSATVVSSWTALTTFTTPSDIRNANDVVTKTDLPLQTKLYPNPLGQNATLHVQFNSSVATATVQLFDVTGKLLATNTVAGADGIFTTEFDTNTLTSGIYFIEVIAGDKTETKQFVK